MISDEAKALIATSVDIGRAKGLEAAALFLLSANPKTAAELAAAAASLRGVAARIRRDTAETVLSRIAELEGELGESCE